MKRKAEQLGASPSDTANGASKRPALNGHPDALRARFRSGLFDSDTVGAYTKSYAQSNPYKHAVVTDLIDDGLLRAVRSEIIDNIHFTPKETDIYKIHQSGDLANLDGLPEDALKKLPSLLKLRDALYGHEFRQWISHVSGAGPVSGKKTDMAVNVYVPGCHLLCHDDVIGSRRVSYILYLTDPDKPWNAEWGGALRLYPTDELRGKDGQMYKVPTPDWNKSIPPAWNQLSFFAVQPGESFHDVEEVYKAPDGSTEDDGGRVRMAISGWFHIPQEGEEGFEPGLEAAMAEKSSLQQLQGKADEFDLPKHEWLEHPDAKVSDPDADDILSEEDSELLLKFITPGHLVPDAVAEMNERFTDEPTLHLHNFLQKRFAPVLKEQLTRSPPDALSERSLNTSKPPYKHRYQYVLAQPGNSSDNPFQQVLDELLPSKAFKKWLSLVTGLTLKRSSVMARRFRRGMDYQLAQNYEGEAPQLEYTLSVTPTEGWGADLPEDETNEESEKTKLDKGKGKEKKDEPADEEDNVGGYELYMAGDDPDDEDAGSDGGVTIPESVKAQTGAGDRRSAKAVKADPAVYKAAADDEDDGILLTSPASWNSLTLVLRDRGTLKFVKYVSQSAAGDRYDYSGLVEVDDEDEDAEDGKGGDDVDGGDAVEADEEDEEEDYDDYEDGEEDEDDDDEIDMLACDKDEKQLET